MKTLENKGFVPIRNAMGWNVSVKPPSDSKIVNEINGLEHVSYGMAVMAFERHFLEKVVVRQALFLDDVVPSGFIILHSAFILSAKAACDG